MDERGQDAAPWADRRLDRIAGLSALALLLIGCVMVLRPFLSSALWAIILVFTTWPLFERLRHLLRGMRSVAALIMTIALTLALVVPVLFVGGSLADSAEAIFDDLRSYIDTLQDAREPPEWLDRVPVFSEELERYWREIRVNTGQLIGTVSPYLGPVRSALVEGSQLIGRSIVELALSVLISFFLYRDGPYAVRQLRYVVERLLGRRARRLISVAGDTIKSVVYGLIGTAFVQSVLAFFGFLVVGLAQPFLLTVLVFLLALFPIAGPPIVWIPVGIWLLTEERVASGLFMLIWGTFVVSSVDNFVRPYLISVGSRMPFLLVFFGVVGGLIAFGILGIFLGPMLLAVTLALVREWIATAPESPGAAEGDTAIDDEPVEKDPAEKEPVAAK